MSIAMGIYAGPIDRPPISRIHDELDQTEPGSDRYWELIEKLADIPQSPPIQLTANPMNTLKQ